jgi:hypothetical protein
MISNPGFINRRRVLWIKPYSIGEWLAELECGHAEIVFAKEGSATPQLTSLVCSQCSGLVWLPSPVPEANA